MLYELVSPTPDPVPPYVSPFAAQAQLAAQQQGLGPPLFGTPDGLGALFNSLGLQPPRRKQAMDEFWFLLGQMVVITPRERLMLINNTKVTAEDLDALEKALGTIAARAYQRDDQEKVA